MSIHSQVAQAQDAAVAALVAAFAGNAYRILTAVADRLELSVAYIDRLTVEAYLERALDEDEWARFNAAFSAMDFDQYLSDADDNTRAAWVDTVLNFLADEGTPILAAVDA